MKTIITTLFIAFLFVLAVGLYSANKMFIASGEAVERSILNNRNKQALDSLHYEPTIYARMDK